MRELSIVLAIFYTTGTGVTHAPLCADSTGSAGLKPCVPCDLLEGVQFIRRRHPIVAADDNSNLQLELQRTLLGFEADSMGMLTIGANGGPFPVCLVEQLLPVIMAVLMGIVLLRGTPEMNTISRS